MSSINRTAINFKNVQKTFATQKSRGTMFSAIKGVFLNNNSDSQRFVALNKISFEIQVGHRLGVVGNNGAGKSTLLKLISGIHLPNEGYISVNGNINLLTAYGVGMLDELSVRDNIYLYGSIYGMDREQIDEKLNEIIQWAELENFVSSKLKTLSSGMKMRLAFSTARYFQSDICILDEALSAGDKDFRLKSLDYFQNSIYEGKTYVISSHDLNFIETFCDKTLWLDHGNQMAFGQTDQILKQYIDYKSPK